MINCYFRTKIIVPVSLVVARIIEGKIQIESDSKIYDRDSARNDLSNCKLKSFILDPTLSLSYAGKEYFGELAYQNFDKHSDNGKDRNQYVNYLLALHKESNNSTDFIVAGYNVNDPILLKISDGKVMNEEVSWVGDRFAFSKFQEFYHSFLSKGKTIRQSLNEGFREVLKQEITETVGNFQITIRTNDKNFTDMDTGFPRLVLEYGSSSEIILGRNQTISFEKKGQPAPMTSGDATSGTYMIGHFTPKDPRELCHAIHFGYGRFGVFFLPNQLTEKKVYKDVSAREFLNQVCCDFDVVLTGLANLDSNTMGFVMLEGKCENKTTG